MARVIVYQVLRIIVRFFTVETDDDSVQWIVVGVSAGLLLILMVLLVVLPYWMWKRGHIFIMKIVYHFKSFEDDGTCYSHYAIYF